MLAILIRNSRDAYRIRPEILSLSVMWIVVAAVGRINLEFGVPKNLSAGDFIIVGQVITFIVANILPLAYAWIADSAEQIQDTESFAVQLESVHFRYAIA